jgi:nucleotide-binding universal stress UspA family protein
LEEETGIGDVRKEGLMIKSLLLPVDSSIYTKSALEHALELATAYEAHITGLYVFDVRYLYLPPYLDSSYAFEDTLPSVGAAEVMDKLQAKSGRLLDDFRGAVETSGVKGEIRTEQGVPGQTIAEIGGTHDLIVMGKRGEHARWGRELLGLTTESVVRRSDTPVLLAEKESRPLNKMLVMYDGSHPANRALKIAANIAAHVVAGITIFTANDDLKEGARVRDEAIRYLEAQALNVDFVLQAGPAEDVLEYLEKDPVDLLVVGTRGYSALRRLILGSTAEYLMRSTTLPLLLVP